MKTINSSNKRIAKNTFYLYLRMFLAMLVALYTSRIVLDVLGVNDYGVYTIVGGVIALFGFFNSSMTATTQRFLSFEIGIGDEASLKKTFNATLNIHISIAILIFILAETIGLWFVSNKLNIPSDRLDAIHWVYQFSILSFLVGVLQVPYNALIISRERMGVYAVMSIADVILKLVVVYILVIYKMDKLILYSFLQFTVVLVIALSYRYYCYRNLKESRYLFHFDKKLYKSLASFSGWSLFGNAAAIGRAQGSNILLNLFFGTVLNAAYGITMQVQGAVSVFVTNFQTAFNPQIVKTFAANEPHKSLLLIFQSSRFSFFLMLLIASPILMNIDFILELWLEAPPDYTSLFVKLTLINLMVDCISGPLIIGAQATGRIKWYQIIIGTFILLCVPISYLILKFYPYPEIVFIVIIIINLLALFFRVFFLQKIMNLKVKLFFKEVLFKISLVALASVILAYFLRYWLVFDNRIWTLIVTSLIISIINIALVFLLGLKKTEKKMIINFIKSKI